MWYLVCINDGAEMWGQECFNDCNLKMTNQKAAADFIIIFKQEEICGAKQSRVSHLRKCTQCSGVVHGRS